MLSIKQWPPLLRPHIKLARVVLCVSVLVNIGLTLLFSTHAYVMLIIFIVLVIPFVLEVWAMARMPRPAWLQTVDYSVCGSCGYVLRKGKAADCCSECGEPYDLELVRAYWAQYCEHYGSFMWTRRGLHWQRDVADAHYNRHTGKHHDSCC